VTATGFGPMSMQAKLGGAAAAPVEVAASNSTRAVSALTATD
jgi:hypothetical protein